MKSIFAAVVLMVVGLGLEACKDFPGADGRYATHDRGALNSYALTSKSSGPRCSDGGRAVSDREGRELDRSKGAEALISPEESGRPARLRGMLTLRAGIDTLC